MKVNYNHLSPNFDTRKGHRIDMLVLHYTGMESGEAAISRLCDETSKVSAHYVVGLDGGVYGMVDESMRAWHAGISSWRENTNINQRSIGVEIVNKGHELGYTTFPQPQMEAVMILCESILKRHRIPARNVVAHSDVAPTRKQDPGELFSWELLASRKIGLFPEPKNTKQFDEEALKDYGYDITDMEKAIIAFQRHFRPHKLSGAWDDECGNLLAALLAMV
jgi:N-acetylmuramoyl-L-alanine amidase